MQISHPGLAEYVLHLIDGDTVLDFGCGAGLYGFLLKYSWHRTKSNKPFKRVEGIDSSPATVKEGNRLGFYNKVHLGTSLTLPFPDNHFDTVICLECLEHLYIEDVNILMAELVRVCKKNLIISTPPHNLVSNAHWCHAEIERLKNSTMNQKTFFEKLGELHKCYIDASIFVKCGFRTYMDAVKEDVYEVKTVAETNVYYGEKDKINLTQFSASCGIKRKTFDINPKKDYNDDYLQALADQAHIQYLINQLLQGSQNDQKV